MSRIIMASAVLSTSAFDFVDNTNVIHDNSQYHAQPHSIIVCSCKERGYYYKPLLWANPYLLNNF